MGGRTGTAIGIVRVEIRAGVVKTGNEVRKRLVVRKVDEVTVGRRKRSWRGKYGTAKVPKQRRTYWGLKRRLRRRSWIVVVSGKKLKR